MKVKLLSVVLFVGVVSAVQAIGPPSRVPCGEGCGCDKPTRCPGKLVCPPGEMLVDRPPFCEPTCCDDCSGTKPFPIGYLVKPTCICKPGLVRHNGVCIEPCQCPSKEEPPVTTPKSCIGDDVPYQNQAGGCQTCNSIPPVKPPCGCPQSTPSQCPCQLTALPCPCQGAPAVGCPAPCYPPPPVAPPNPCAACARIV